MVMKGRIELAHDPGYQYAPGEILKGVIKLQTENELEVDRIKVVFHGEMKSCSRTLCIGRDVGVILRERPSGSNKLEIGNHEYPFEFLIPNNIPPSFEGPHGSINYVILFGYESKLKTCVLSKGSVIVVPRKNINNIPLVLKPRELRQIKNTGLIFKNGSIDFKVRFSVFHPDSVFF